MSRKGPPTKLTPLTVAALAHHMPTVIYLRPAARLAGIGLSTLKGWLARARRVRAGEEEADATEKPLLLDLLAAHERVRAQAIAEAVASIKAAFKTDWRAAAWWLGNIDPEKWGDKRHEIKRLSEKVEELAKAASGAGSGHASFRQVLPFVPPVGGSPPTDPDEVKGA